MAWKWSVRALGRELDGAAVYRELLLDEPAGFWLDGSAGESGVAGQAGAIGESGVPGEAGVAGTAGVRRVSILGTSSGIGAEVLVRDVADGDVFAELQRLLIQRRAEVGTAPAEIAELFPGGYVGYFGYELKALTGGAAAHEAPTPDALWIWANRFLVIDHETGRSFAVALHPEGDGDAADWLDRAERAAGAGPSPSTGRLARAERAAGARPNSGPLDRNGRSTGSSPGEWPERARRDAGHRSGPPGEGTGTSRATASGVAVERPAVAVLGLEPYLEQDRATYLRDVDACLVALKAGETYEVCLTNRVRLPAVADPFGFYCWQRAVNPARYSAFLRYGDLAVASSSPERFLTVAADGWAECRPIKGTTARRDDPAQDRLAAKALAEDEKSRAENLMIADLIRNDLGRVSEPGTVQVPQLMAVDSTPTVHQLVTTVRGRLRPGLDALDAVRACFPPGSMTGAPKIRTMAILDRLESSARGVYSGGLGWLGTDGRADLCVVIRTAVLTPAGTVVGAGGAIVLDSDPAAEYDEMLLKATATVRGGSNG